MQLRESSPLRPTGKNEATMGLVDPIDMDCRTPRPWQQEIAMILLVFLIVAPAAWLSLLVIESGMRAAGVR